MRKKLVIDDLPSSVLQKMKRKKEEDGFKDRTWGSWLSYTFRDLLIQHSPGQDINVQTRSQMLELWCKNFAENLADIRAGDTITDLVPADPDTAPKGPSVTIGAGPSIWKHNHLAALKEAIDNGTFKGLVCATDKMLKPCLEHGIVPYMTCGVDGSPIIKQFYDTPIVEKYAHQIRAVINATTHHDVIEQCKKIGVHIYWFNPLFDDPNRTNESFTKLQRLMTITEKHPNGVPSVSCGGNAGCATWTLAFSLLRRSPNALLGIDMGYPEGTKLEDTPYYSALEYTPDSTLAVDQFYKKIYHPVFKTYAYADKIFLHYRESWRSAALRTPIWSETVNCTEGGTLFGERIKCMKFKTWLDKLGSKS